MAGVKELISLTGSNCQNKIQIYAEFTRSFKPLSFDIIGGNFISEEEYNEDILK